MDYAANCRLGPWRTKLVPPNNQKCLAAVFPGYGVLGPGYWVASAQNYPHKYCRVSPDKGLPINCIKSLGNSLLLEGRLAT